MKKKNNAFNTLFSKYRTLFLSITAFLLLIAALLGLNLYSALRIGEGTAIINASAYMRDLNHAITRDLFNLRLSYGEDPNTPHMQATINRLEENIKLYGRNLAAFSNGGTLIDADGDEVSIKAQSLADSTPYIAKLDREWAILRPLIDTYLSNARSIKASLTDLDLAVNQSQSSSIALAENTNKIATQIKNQGYKQADLLTYLQLFGILAVIIYFIVFIVFVLRQLLRTDAQLDEARKETTEIMDTIQEGLFLIDADLHIGMQQSNELREILPVENIAGKGLDEVIKNMVNEADLSNTKRFIKQLFNKRVKENLLDDLNPLSQVKVVIKGDDGSLTNRYLRFKFNRVYENKKIIRVLVTVSNITESVNLQEQLEYERQHNQQQTEMLIKILHLDQELLSGFIRRTSQVTQKVNNLLKSSGSSQSQLRNKLNDIFREVHGFKGEASALEFDSFVSVAEEAEDKLKELRNRSSLTGDDFMGVTVVLNRLIGLNEEIAHTQSKLTEFSLSNEKSVTNSNQGVIIRNMSKFAKQIAERQHKRIALTTIGFENAATLPTKTSDLLREIITQLLRNAIAHGIEPPEERIAKGKNEVGQITVRFNHHTDHAELTVEDDGIGINLEALREKLRTDPHYKNKDITSMKEKELYRVLFLPGFTTAESSTEDAGRGEGMAIIRDRIQQLPQGKLAIQSMPDSYTRFIIRFALLERE